MESILTSIKKLLGMGEDYTAFDTDVIIHINSALMNLCQIGVGPKNGFFITDSTATWSDFLNDLTQFEAVKTYVYLRVKLVFDPPANSFVVDSMSKQADKLEWLLGVQVDDMGRDKFEGDTGNNNDNNDNDNDDNNDDSGDGNGNCEHEELADVVASIRAILGVW